MAANASVDQESRYLLVTTDPVLAGTGMQKSDAYTLVMKRLERRQWPIYEKTRLRENMVPGVRVAFYVAGKREHRGEIVATATVQGRRDVRAQRTDPPEYLTEQPDLILELDSVEILPRPVVLREFVPKLSFCPKDLKNWGSALQGGVRRLTDRDWALLFPPIS